MESDLFQMAPPGLVSLGATGYLAEHFGVDGFYLPQKSLVGGFAVALFAVGQHRRLLELRHHCVERAVQLICAAFT